MRSVLHWIVPLSVLTVLGAAALEGEALAARHQARQELRRALATAPAAAQPEELRERLRSIARGPVASGSDAWAAGDLTRLAEEQPSALTWRLAALAETWNGGREAAAARAAGQASRLAPGDGDLAALAERALDHATWARARAVARPLGAIAGGLVALALLAAALRRAARAGRRRWIRQLGVRVTGAADGQPAAEGAPLCLAPQAAQAHLDVFLCAPPGRCRSRCVGPTLAVALSHADASRTVRLTPVKDVRQDAVRVRLSAPTLALLKAYPGLWRVMVTLDGSAVAQAAIRVLEAPRLGLAC